MENKVLHICTLASLRQITKVKLNQGYVHIYIFILLGNTDHFLKQLQFISLCRNLPVFPIPSPILDNINTSPFCQSYEQDTRYPSFLHFLCYWGVLVAFHEFISHLQFFFCELPVNITCSFSFISFVFLNQFKRPLFTWQINNLTCSTFFFSPLLHGNMNIMWAKKTAQIAGLV